MFVMIIFIFIQICFTPGNKGIYADLVNCIKAIAKKNAKINIEGIIRLENGP